ncbi:hypothetical protein L1987_11415 [Smallanthus sonchifolius]|uniref:Uncharacterized protein n=1 Tax=Smallanthus sonchifolius TaxID=185202 RepID=A0ACB9JBE1_9ASTR|nr:hypothetical protein L1987_11415 [Smallanthus sonchifolius]
MLKIIKGIKKGSKPEVIEPPPGPNGPSDVTVNHASRSAIPPAQLTHVKSQAIGRTPAPQTSVIEVTPLLKDVPVSERHVLFIRKVNMCSVMFDFSDALKKVKEKEIKRQNLEELVDLVRSGSSKMNEIMQQEMVDMISMNIFRSLPPAAYENTGAIDGDPEEDDMYLEPSWPHLQLVFIFETERHPGLGDLLEVLASIINGLAVPMKEEYKLFLVRVLLPLHKAKFINYYHQQLSYCITQLVEKDYRLANIVIRGLLKYWPVSNGTKEILFLGELEEVLDVTQSAEFQCCMVPLFRQVGRCINSPNFQVAERALFWWNNEHTVDLIAQYRDVILPIIFEPLEKNVQGHWNQAINGLSSNVRKMFIEMDADLFEECSNQFLEKEAIINQMREQRELNWKKLESMASEPGGDDMVS